MRSARERIVQQRDVAGPKLERRARRSHRHRHRAKMHRHVIAHRHRAPAAS